ncbi:MAG: hypothetical protein IPH13_16735 [Planctomycetes bacterium]|nr:hypothetical protein [Planctomycetota bacterium]MCC7173155.1 hypothetical protein [Planctomycetota bacterium]
MKRILITLGSSFVLASFALAQDSDEMKAKQLIAQIKKDLAKIDDLLLRADEGVGADAKAAMDDVKKNIEKLLQQTRDAQNQVIDNIEELARLTKYKKSSESQGESQNQQDQPPQQQNQEREKDREPENLKEQGQPKPQDQSQGERKPEDGEPEKGKGEQRDEGMKPPPSETEKHEREDTRGRWGNLPPKVQEQIDARSYDRIPAKYRRILDEYYRKSGKNDG